MKSFSMIAFSSVVKQELSYIIRRRGLASRILMGFLLLIFFASGAYAGVYYSQGSTDATQLGSWNQSRDGSGSIPLSFSSGDTFVVQSGHTMTTSAAWSISGAGNLLQIENGGTVNASSLISCINFRIDNGGTYIHAAQSLSANGSAGDIPGSGNRSFGASATVEIRKWGNGGTSLTPLPSGANWGNLTINVTDSLSASWNQSGNLTSIQGDLTLLATGSPNSNTRFFRLTDNTSFNLTIGGNLVIGGTPGGGLNIVAGNGSGGTMTVTVGGSLLMTGGNIQSSSNTQFPTVIFSDGSPSVNFTQSGGTFQTSNINWQVASGKTVTLNTLNTLVLSSGKTFTVNGRLDFAPGSIYLSGAGNFTLNAGGTLGIASVNGIGLGTGVNDGNIRLSGTRTFSSAANYVFMTSLSGTTQVTGTGFPSVVNNLTISNSAVTQGVSLTNSVTVNGLLSVTSGKLVTGPNSVTLGPTATLAEGIGSTVVGTINTTRTVTETSGTETFGGIGADITLNGTALGTTTITRVTGTASTGNGKQSILRYFDIDPAINAGLGAALTYHYDNSELNGQSAGTLELYRSSDNGATWVNRHGTVNTADQTITLSGVDAFSRWTASNTSNSIEIGPSVSSIDPDSMVAGSPGFTLTILGSNFIDGVSIVRFNGSNRSTTFISSTELSASISASDLLTAGTYNITVFNSGGGGNSNAVPFVVLPGPIHHFGVEKSGGGTIPTQLANIPFPIRISAKDSLDNIVTDFTGTVDLTSDGVLSDGGGTTPAFTNGVLSSHNVTFSNTGTFSLSVTRTGGSENGASNSFIVRTPRTFYSQGNLNSAQVTSWNSNRFGGDITPSDFTSGDVFVIQSSHSMTTGSSWTISGTGSSLQIESGATLTATALVSSPEFQINNGGTYIHQVVSSTSNGNSNDIPGSQLRNFGSSSTVEIRRWGNGGSALASLPPFVAWGNLTIDLVDTIVNGWNQQGTLTTVQGNLRILKTGSPNGVTHRFVRLTDSTPFTLTIGGDLVIGGRSGGGDGLNLICCSGNGITVNVNIGGNFTMTGGDFECATGSSVANNNNQPTVTFTGGSPSVNFTQTGGILLTENIHWRVATGKTVTMSTVAPWMVSSNRTLTVEGRLNFAPGANHVSGSGNVFVASGATLGIGSINGIGTGTTTSDGNIRVSGTRTFDPASNYEFMTSLVNPTQITGLGFPATVNNLTFNNPNASQGLVLSAPITVNGTLALSSGKLSTGSNTVTLGPTAVLSESAGKTIVGTVATTRTVSATAGTETFGGIGAEVTLNGTPLGTTTVTRKTGDASSGNGFTSILRYFDITPSTNTGLNAGLLFRYDNSELNSQSATTLELYRSTDAGGSWGNRGGIVNTIAGTIALTGIDAFSRWTASNTLNPLEPTSTPSISSISPSSKTAGDAGFTLTVNGSNFINGNSVVRLNGQNRTTTFVNTNQLTATIPAGDLLLAGKLPITVLNTGGGGSSSADTLTVHPNTAASFIIESASGGNIQSQQAGRRFSIRITARDAFGNTATGFSGSVAISSSGNLVEGGGITPSFVNGVLSSREVMFSNPGDFTITATYNGGSVNGTSNTFTVTHGPLHHFVVEKMGGGPLGTQIVGIPLFIQVIAQDTMNNVASSFAGTVEITSAGNLSSGGGTSPTFANGILSPYSVTFSNTGTFALSATRTDGTETGTCNNFVVKTAVVYYSQGSLSVTTLSSWNTNRGGGGSSPTNFSDGDRFVIQGGHLMSTSAPWSVSGSASTIVIESGGTLHATQLVQTDNFELLANATYIHDFHSSSPNGSSNEIPGTVSRSFDPASTVEIRRWANFGPVPVPLPPFTSWGNLTIDIQDWVAGGPNEHVGWNMQGTLTDIRGNFTILHTGSPDSVTHKFIRLTDTTSFTLTIGGDLRISGSEGDGLNMICCNGEDITAVIRIKGNYIQTGGFFESSTGTVPFNESNDSRVIFSGGQPSASFIQSDGFFFSRWISWEVDTGKTLTMEEDIDISEDRQFIVKGRLNFLPGNISIDGEGDFILAAGGTLGLASMGGIDTGFTTGNIRVTGTRTFDPSANYDFLSTTAGTLQQTGTGFPPVANNVTISNTVTTLGVGLTKPLTINGSLTVNAGTTLSLNNMLLSFAGASLTNNGKILGAIPSAPLSKLSFSGTVAQSYLGSGTFGTLAAPVAILEVNNPAGVTIHPAITNLNVNRVNLLQGVITNSNKITIGNSGSTTSIVQIGQAAGTATGGSFDVSPTYTLGSGSLDVLYLQESGGRTTGVEIPVTRNIHSLTIDNTNGVVLAGGNLTLNGPSGNMLTLANGTFTLDSTKVLTIANGGTITATGGNFAAGMGTVAFGGTGTVSGSVAFHKVSVGGGVNFGTGASISGSLAINVGGSVNTNPPTYLSGSTLVYNTGGSYGRSAEWNATSGAGYPHHVRVTNNTSVDLNNGSPATARELAGVLQIDSGSALSLGAMTAPLTVMGDVTNNGTLVLSTQSGGDLILSGNLTTNGVFTTNNRSVLFQGDAAQLISSSSNPLTIDYIRLSKTGGSVILGADVQCLGPAGGNSLEFNGTTDIFDLGGKTLTLASTLGGSNSFGSFRGSGNSNLILNGTGPLGFIRFVSDAQTLNNLTINRVGGGSAALGDDLTINGALTLTAGTFIVGANHLVLNGPAIAGSSANLVTSSLSSLSYGGTAAGISLPSHITLLQTLTVNNPNGVALGNDLTIIDSLTLLSGDLVTGPDTVTLAESATLLESPGSTVVGTVTTIRTVSVTSGNERFGNIGAVVGLNGTAMGETRVTRRTGLASTGNNEESILRYFDIDPAINSNLNATLIFKYDNSELNGHTPSLLELYKSSDGGVTWDGRFGTVDTATRSLALTGIQDFSRWTASDTAHILEELPDPVLLSISPTEKVVGSSGFTMLILGSDFVAGRSIVRLNNEARSTTFINENTLTAVIPASDLDSAGTFEITVFNGDATVPSSPLTFTVKNVVANVKVFLGGAYSSGTMTTHLLNSNYIPHQQPYNSAPWNYTGAESTAAVPAGIVDWVLLEVRMAPAQSSTIYKRAAFLRSDGMVVDLDGVKPPALVGISAGSYYLVITHRNHLDVMSSTTLALSDTSGLYDFTTGVEQYYGDEASALSGGKYGMTAGDHSGDDYVDSDDFVGPDNELFLDGYRQSDLNLDGFVDSDDFVSPDNNLFRGSNVPR